MLFDRPFTKETLDQYLKELAKEFRKRYGKTVPAEVILIGSAAVLVNYGFREKTYDMDAIIISASSMKDIINYVGDKFGLPEGWLNTDFMNTTSYTPRIIQYSKYYHTYSNTVTFRTISGEYLIAMKLKSGRKYKYDRSDIIGILLEQEKMGDPLTLDRIKKAVCDLYDSYDSIEEEVRLFLEQALADGNYSELFSKVRDFEKENRATLIRFHKEKPKSITTDNVNDVLDALRRKKEGKD